VLWQIMKDAGTDKSVYATSVCASLLVSPRLPMD